ncbi:MAG: nucleoside diphosphate kinase regulator [Sphingomonadaceae bacterium]
MSNPLNGEKPEIHLVDSEADTLSNLAMAAEARSPEVTAKLLEEIDRAIVHSRAELPTHVVSMGSRVQFVDEGSGARRTVDLVWPGEANIEEGRLSVMTLVGAGLIGMQEGEAIEWPDRTGHFRRLRIAKVSQPIQVRGRHN